MPSNEREISRLQRADALGLAFLRTIILLNAGAILAILTFIGNAETSHIIQFEIDSIKCAMWAFLVGITSTLTGLVISYSYTASAPQTCWHKFWDKYLIRLNFLIAAISVSAFVYGVARLINGSGAPQ